MNQTVSLLLCAQIRRISLRLPLRCKLFFVASLALVGASGCATATSDCVDVISASAGPAGVILAPFAIVCAAGAVHEAYQTIDTIDSLTSGGQPVKETEEQKAERIAILKRRADRDAESAIELAWRTGTVSYVEDLASQGDTEAIQELLRLSTDPEVAANFAKASGNLTYLEKLASAEDVNAGSEYAKITGDPKYIDATTAFSLYESLSGERKSFKRAWTLLCHAANSGHGKAQQEVGTWHRISVWNSGSGSKLTWLRDDIGILPDNRHAYMWYTLADTHGDQSSLWLRETIETDMTGKDIAQAERMVRDWKPGDCPSAENRLGPLGNS